MSKIVRCISVVLVLATFSFVLLGCSGTSGGDHKSPAMSEHKRDSILSKSKLPGADIVGKAMAVSDSAAARAALQDSTIRY